MRARGCTAVPCHPPRAKVSPTREIVHPVSCAAQIRVVFLTAEDVSEIFLAASHPGEKRLRIWRKNIGLRQFPLPFSVYTAVLIHGMSSPYTIFKEKYNDGRSFPTIYSSRCM